ncbi:hypothetical protein ANRL3_01630 [Anaerolineae bacterium]|nr:hypothetical protein ANRL3_01630 [Anaerolineae bacterium]
MTVRISLKVHDYQRSLSDDEVIAAARRVITDGLPDEAKQYSQWAVEIDGELIGAKWLLSHVTGIPTSDFQSQYATYVFSKRLGLTVVNARNDQFAPAGRKAAPAPDNDARRLDILEAQVAEIRVFLAGRTDNRPSDDKLCEWIHFCYTFELHAEARDLYPLIDPSQVNTWYFERTKKLAKICAMRVP